jgi:HAD superfamily hydrolase (TIGR01450 family)
MRVGIRYNRPIVLDRKDPIDLAAFDAVLLDLDGTLLRQDDALPGAAELVDRLRTRQQRFAVVSNSTSGPIRVTARLRDAGVTVPATQVWTAAQAACDYVVAKVRGLHKRPPRVFNLGTRDVDEMLAGRGELIGPDSVECDVVLAGAPANAMADQDRQRAAIPMLRRGAQLVGVCADRLYPSRRGIEFGCGALCSYLGYAAGVRATFCGKPEQRFFLEVCRRMQVDPRRCLLLGDNLEADILGARGVGMTSGLVLGGVTESAELEDLPDVMRPDFVLPSLTSLTSLTEPITTA